MKLIKIGERWEVEDTGRKCTPATKDEWEIIQTYIKRNDPVCQTVGCTGVMEQIRETASAPNDRTVIITVVRCMNCSSGDILVRTGITSGIPSRMVFRLKQEGKNERQGF